MYKPGRTYVAPYFSTYTTTSCHPGLYFSGLEWLAMMYPGAPLAKVYVRLTDIVVAGDKARCRRFRVLGSVEEGE